MPTLFQPPLPSRYAEMPEAEMADGIVRHKRAFGDALVISAKNRCGKMCV